MSNVPTAVPLEVQQYVLAETGEPRLRMKIAVFHFDVTSREFLGNEVVGVSLVERFPFVSELRLEHMDVVIKGDDPENPLSQYTFAQFRCGPLGTFYFLVQGVEPSSFFSKNNELNPSFSKENVLKSLAPGATVAKVKVTRVSAKVCCNCMARSAALTCLPCKEKTRNKFYYCSQSCQGDHWKYHKAICMKNRI